MDLRISSKILLMENGIDAFPKSKSILKIKGNINESSLGDEAKANNNNPFGSRFLKNVANSSPSSSGARSISSDGEANSIDDDLTNLTWLHDGNLLQNLCQTQNIKENRLSERGNASKPTDFDNEESSLDDPNSHTLEEKKTDGRVPYNPLIQVNMKPPYSFSCLIFMAIEESPNKALPVKEIYSWIILHFPYFRNAPIGWKNSVRHNLSLNKCFCKVDKNKSQNMGKGSLWCVDADFRPNLLQALRRAPLCPFSECNDKELADIVSGGECDSLSQSSNQPVKTRTDLFPFLSKRLYDATDIDKEVDVASTMLNLKNAMPQRNFTDSSKHKEIKKKRYLNLGSNAEFVQSAKTRKTEIPSNNATPYVDHTYSASTQMPQLENVQDLHPELSPRPDTERPRLHIINNNNINKDAKIIVNNFDRKMKEEESSRSPVPLEESNDERVVAKNKCSQSVIVDGSKLRMYVKKEEEERSLEEGAHALLSLANMARMHNNLFQGD